MELNELIKLISKKKWLIFWTTILGLFLAFDLMVIQTPLYKASSRILVIQKQVAGQDIYAVSKSAQYLSQVLREAVYSDSFFNQVISTDQVDLSDFASQTKKRRKEWNKKVKVRIARDLGVMEIDVFYPVQEKAGQINQAITDILKKEHQLYHGAADVEVKVLDEPLVSQRTDAAKLWYGSVLGGIIGFLIGLGWAYKKEQEKETSFLDGNFSV